MQGISCECARGKGTAALARLDREPCRPSGEGQRDGRRTSCLVEVQGGAWQTETILI